MRDGRLNKGFGLLEIILTILIFTVGMVSLLQAANSAIYADGHLTNLSLAIQLAQEKMEEIKGASSYAAVDGYALPRTNIGGDFAGFDREVAVSGDPKQVEVNVYWGLAGDEQTISLVTLVADYNF